MTKEKFHIEYDMRNTPVAMLWSYISTAYGLKEWFADNARQTGKEVVLDWNGVEQTVQIVAIRTDKFVRYHWTEENDKSYFELRISQSELTDGTMLTVTTSPSPTMWRRRRTFGTIRLKPCSASSDACDGRLTKKQRHP